MTNNLPVPTAYRAIDGAMVTSMPPGAVFRRNGKPTTTSARVADLFGKRHDNVLRDIRKLLATAPELALSFEEQFEIYTAGNGVQRQRTIYAINQRGEALLVMGFTGPEALQFKQQFLDAFDHLAEREKDNYAYAMRSLPRGPSVHQLKQRKARLSLR